MNNNCTKCGNPLQAGTTICPICGTNNINAGVAPAAPATPVAPATPAPAPADPAAVAPAPAPVVPAPADPAPVAPATPVPAPAPAPADTAPVAPATPAPAPAVPVPTPSATPAAVAPAKEKKPKDKKLFIIVGIIAAVIIVGAIVAMVIINNSSKVEEPPVNDNNNNNQNKAAVSSKMSLNGYSFTLPNGWSVDTSGGTTAIVDKDVSTIVQLQHDADSFANLNKDNMTNYLTGRGYSNINSADKTIGGKKGLLFTASKAGNAFQYDFYYIDNNEVIVGAGVVYIDSAAKNKNSRFVEQIMNTLSYSETVNMASEINML